jgi:hypothetical protein
MYNTGKNMKDDKTFKNSLNPVRPKDKFEVLLVEDRGAQ